MKRDNQSYSCHDDEYTNEALNREYYDRPCRFGTPSEGCKAYVRSGFHTALPRSKYKDAKQHNYETIWTTRNLTGTRR